MPDQAGMEAMEVGTTRMRCAFSNTWRMKSTTFRGMLRLSATIIFYRESGKWSFWLLLRGWEDSCCVDTIAKKARNSPPGCWSWCKKSTAQCRLTLLIAPTRSTRWSKSWSWPEFAIMAVRIALALPRNCLPTTDKMEWGMRICYRSRSITGVNCYLYDKPFLKNYFIA